MRFEWDSAKAKENLRKHSVSFDEAITVFADPNAIEWFDTKHSDHEERYVILGFSLKLRLLIVVYTEREIDVTWIISARKAKKAEAKTYDQGQA